MPTAIARLIAAAAIARLIAAATIATLIACSSSGTITSVTIDDGNRTISLGDTPTLTATVEVTGNTSTTVTWTSSNETAATIDPNGQITSLTTGTTTITATSTTDPTKSDAITLTINPPGTLRWTRQFGTSSPDIARGIATDTNGNVYTTGYTLGDLEGPNAGGFDAFVRSYDSNGTHRWTRQFGTSDFDRAIGIATDANGNVYTTGETYGALEGPNAGSADAFIRSYDSDGTHRWTHQFGTSSSDIALGIATDTNGNVYTTGNTLGNLDGSNAGFGDPEAFISSYDSNGTHRWTRQFRLGDETIAFGIATDANGNVYTTGYRFYYDSDTDTADLDAFIRSYDSNGTVRWTHVFGTNSGDHARGIATDTNGNFYATGYTTGALDGPNAGGADAFIRSYDSNGVLRWTRQFGTDSSDIAHGIATDAHDNVYATGDTDGDLDGSNAGDRDAFIRSYGR